MKKIIVSIFICFILVDTSFAANKYENNHFSINALVVDDNIGNTQPLIMALPASEGFSPNVNVLIQQYSDSLKSYADLSVNQFKQYNFIVLQNIQKKDSLLFEYTGNMQGRKLHWYAIAYKKGNNVFLVTATATESQWKVSSQILMDCVNSFILK